MYNPTLGWLPASSYVEPVTPPDVEPGASPLVCLQVNAAWLPYVLGSLQQLCQPTTWNTTDPTALQTALDRSQALLEMFGIATECTAVEFRFTDTCLLQYSVDGGTTWLDVAGWGSFAPDCFTGPAGPAGTNGTNGTNGVTPQLRWSGCVFQVSYDSGSTWTDVPGFATSSLQTCLQGSPGNPGGVSPPTSACNIANWLAIQILQGSMGSLASSIGSSATTLEAALGLFGLAASFTGVSAIFFEAAGIFVAAGTAIGETALNTAATDTTLRQDLTCAIFTAIEADGAVTASNFAAILTNINAISYATPGIVGLIHDYVSNLGFAGINAIQAEGQLYDGDCSTCGTWCWEYDFTVSDGGWSQYSANPSHWVAGQGWQNNGYAAGHIQLAIHLIIPGTYLTDFEADIVAGAAWSGSADLRGLEWFAGSYFETHMSTAAGTFTATATPSATCTELLVVVYGDGTSATNTIKAVRIKGNGANPFGTSNCM